MVFCGLGRHLPGSVSPEMKMTKEVFDEYKRAEKNAGQCGYCWLAYRVAAHQWNCHRRQWLRS